MSQALQNAISARLDYDAHVAQAKKLEPAAVAAVAASNAIAALLNADAVVAGTVTEAQLAEFRRVTDDAKVKVAAYKAAAQAALDAILAHRRHMKQVGQIEAAKALVDMGRPELVKNVFKS